VANLRLAAALNKARANSLPKENIDKAFKRVGLQIRLTITANEWYIHLVGVE
jgi:transcriptional/translational regulatory protein YebC/TACO1